MKKTLIITALLLVAIQFIPVDRNNPPVDPAKEVQADAAVAAILKRGCYDCHSNETRWPAYASVAPVSFVVASHVHDARKALNFSEYAAIAPETKKVRLERAVMTVNNGRMALPSYLSAHDDARLSAAEKKTLTAWFEAELERI